MKNRVAARWVARQAGLPNMGKILDTLNTLEELSQNIGEVTDTFGLHYRMAAADTDVRSQLDALKKAREGLKAAQGVLQGIEGVIAVYPEDKTAARALRDAQTMVKRFQKHVVDATQMIQRLSKKQMPPALNNLAAAVTRMIQAKLVDPKKLQIEAWQKPDGGYRYGGDGHTFMVTFRIDEHQSHGVPAQLTVWENTGQRNGLQMNVGRAGSATVKDAKAVAQNFLEMLRGWPGMKGEADAAANRKPIALAIADIVQRVCDQMGMSWSRRDVEVSKDFLRIEGSYRSDYLPKEGESEYGWQRYEEMVKDEIKRYRAKLDPALKPYMEHIKEIDVHTGEKGWVYTYIYLK